MPGGRITGVAHVRPNPFCSPRMTSRLLLVDALGIAYRAFHAIGGLATADGRPTNAVYGFIKTLQQAQRILQPSHALVVFDGGLPAERIALLAAYKAQRPPMPDGLRRQLPLLDEYLDAAAVPRLRREGCEADDLLASVASRAAAAGVPVTIVSNDKDLMQLVSPAVRLAPPGRLDATLGPDEVRVRTGVAPAQIPDWLALTGDSADNIPGVPGIGPKTAARLLGQWGSLDALLARAAEVPDPPRGALLAHRALLERNRELVRLRTDLAGDLAVESLSLRPPDPASLLAFYEALEFHTLARALREPTLF